MPKVIITICMGSSCFSRGNRKMIHTIQDYLKVKKLENDVKLQGAHCVGRCDKGPVMKVNENTIYNVTAENLEETLDEQINTHM